MRFLVFGATGFVGHHLADALLDAGHEVHGAARSVESIDMIGDVAVSTCDVTDALAVRALIGRVEPDAIVNLAGLASSAAAHRDPASAFAVNALGAVQVLEAVVEHGGDLRVLVVTSSELYGSVDEDELPLDENRPLRPTTVYAASKAAADLATRAFALAKNVDAVCVRPFNHTGPGQRPDFVCPDFASQVAAIAAGKREPLIEVGNIEVRRDFSDVRDIVRGYMAAIEKGRRGEVYNLCSGRGISIRSVLDDLCQIAGVSPEVRTAPERWRPAEVPAYWGNATKAATELGWQPMIPWRRTLEDVYAHAAREVE